MSSTVLLQASGLQTSPNELERPPGALIEAKNVIIRRDNVIEQRRGFKVYGDNLPNQSDRVKQLSSYRNRLLRHFSNKLQYDSNGQGRFVDFIGNFVETEAGLRMKFIESNGNFYFTTSDGIKKISARSPNDFSNPDVVSNAGAIKAIDFTGKSIYTPNSQSAFLPQDAAVAYRVLWGYKDLNNNLILGAPSQRLVVGNPMLPLLIRDYTRLLITLDSLENSPLTSARINDKNYILTLGLDLTAGAFELFTNLESLADKLDNDIEYAANSGRPLTIFGAAVATNILTITMSSGNPEDYLSAGSEVFLKGTWTRSTTGDLNGARTVLSVTSTEIRIDATGFSDGAVSLTTPIVVSNEFRSLVKPSEPAVPATNNDLIELQNYIDSIIIRLLDFPDTVVSTNDRDLINALDITSTSTVNLDISIPTGIDSRYFLQIYRSSIAQALGPSSFVDVFPGDEMQLVYEAYPTPAELSALRMVVEDQTPDDFRGANLYTNAATGEGILQANDIPPFAKDINRYRNSTFYANTRTQQRLQLNLLGVSEMISDFDSGNTPRVTITNGKITNTYDFILGKQEISTIQTITNVTSDLDDTQMFIFSPTTKYFLYLTESPSLFVPPPVGFTTIMVRLTNSDDENIVAQKIGQLLKAKIDDFIVDIVGDLITVRNLEPGFVSPVDAGDTGFTCVTVQSGTSERAQAQITRIIPTDGSTYNTVGTANYFTISEPFDQKKYRFYFTNGVVVPPPIDGTILIPVEFDGTETDIQIASKIKDVTPNTFIVDQNSNQLTFTTKQYGRTSPLVLDSTPIGFGSVLLQLGALEVAISPVISPAQAVDQTARSFIRILNKNPGESVYGFYLSTVDGVPGKMLLEARSLLLENEFYVLGNNDNTGLSFNPDIAPDDTISSIATGNPSLITTSNPHGLQTGDKVVITSTLSSPQIDGLYEVIVVSDTEFTVPRAVTTGASGGSYIRAINAVFSENEARVNRIYYSKFLQPDAVPIANFFDVGAADMEILRIFPLRDSLFVFKEDGLFRISGDSAPFQLDLFDNSFIVNAPDSVAVANNVIYAWTTQGIQSLTEGGSDIISRPIDNLILRTQSNNFPNFPKATWGIGYESDNSYLVFTVEDREDEVAQIAYRYSTLTKTWTTYDKSSLAGVINMFDDRMYLAASDIPNIEQERKTFSRLDFADRELDSIIGVDRLRKNTVILPSVQGISVGDVITQTQTITAYNFNLLLEKLDFDPGVGDNDYLSTLKMVAGNSPRLQLITLVSKLDADSGVNQTNFESSIELKSGAITNATAAPNTIITSTNHGLLTGRVILIDSSDTFPLIDGAHEVTVIDANTFSIPVNVLTAGTAGNWQTVDTDFRDLKTCYNKVIELLNNDIGVSFANYKPIVNDTLQEVTITAINTITRLVTFDKELEFLVGAIRIFKSIKSTFTYSPTTMGDPLMYKHLREATLMFESRAITRGALSFATDLLPALQKVEFTLEGNGIFGHTNGFGDGFFGGMASSAPFRTYIPRQCMRCRYIIVKFEHNIAREDYKITGMTITGQVGQSTRAYR
jgi:hypothetical protein